MGATNGPWDSTSKVEAITWNILSDKSDSKSGKADAVIWRTNKSEARALLQLDVDLEDAGIETGRGKDYQNQFAPISRYSMTCRRKVFSITHGANATSSATMVAPGL